MKIIALLVLSLLLSACKPKTEESIPVKMYVATPQGEGEYVGTVTITQSTNGLVFTPDLQHLPAGEHGFHLHEHASCAPDVKDNVMTPALAAGGHFDPNHTGKHEGPQGQGHLGDLPVLTVNADGRAQTAVVAPHLMHLKDINNTALMIHVGGDNYSDEPQALGGGGERLVCGVVKL